MLKLLAFRGVVCNVACNIGRRFEADRSVHFIKPHSAIEVEAEQLTLHHVVFFGRNEQMSFRLYGHAAPKY